MANSDTAAHGAIIDNNAEEDKLTDVAPEGGCQAWLVAAGGGAIFFSTLGFGNSFGSFAEYYISGPLQGDSPSNIAWIGSLPAFLQFFVGMLGGPLFDRYGTKVIRPACLAFVVAMMLLSLCKTYWQIMLVQGVLMGLIMGLLQVPSFAAVSQYFDKKRAAALGIVAAGSSVGGVVIPIALSKMLNGSSLSFGWTVRFIGFMILPFMAFAAVTVKPRVPPRTTDFFILSAFKDLRFVLLITALFAIFIGMFMPLFYLPSYAVSRGMSPTMAGYLLAVLNAASTFGRIIPGFLADKFGKINIFALAGVVTGIIITCMNKATTSAGLIVYAVFFGFSSGAIISGASAAFSTFPRNARDVGTFMGMGLAVAGLGALIGPPINGAIVNHYNGFSEISIFSGVLCMVGGGIALVTKTITPKGL